MARKFTLVLLLGSVVAVPAGADVMFFGCANSKTGRVRSIKTKPPKCRSIETRVSWNALGPNFTNSLLIAIPATVISSLIGAVNGYVFAKMPFRGANVLFMVMLLGMFIPYQVILVPLVRSLQEIHLYGTIQGLILVHVIYGIPITTLIFRNHFASMPDSGSSQAANSPTGMAQTSTSVLPPTRTVRAWALSRRPWQLGQRTMRMYFSSCIRRGPAAVFLNEAINCGRMPSQVPPCFQTLPPRCFHS